jgi:hypothetical protein
MHTSTICGPGRGTLLVCLILAGLAGLAGCGDSPTALAAPVIQANPADQSVVAGADAAFSVTAAGTALVYQWQRSTDGGSVFIDLASATSHALTRTAVPIEEDGHLFRVVVGNASGSVLSDPALLTVTPAPVAPAFSAHPSDQSVEAPATATFTVAATGVPTPTLQWQISTGGAFTDLSGATAAEYSTGATAAGDNGSRFRAVATNASGSASSDAATLTVTEPAPALSIVTESPLPSGLTTVPYSVTLAADGGTPPYTWSDPYGSVQTPWSLDATTGVISGTTGFVSLIRWTVRVTDTSDPPQTDEGTFDVTIDLLCDTGLGEATVAGAPSTVGGRFCPERFNPPETTGLVSAVWVETYPYGNGSYYEIVGVHYDAATGQVQYVTFVLHDPTRSLQYMCLLVGTTDRPQCSGVELDVSGGRVRFVDTVVGSGTSSPYTLNGELRY